MQAAETQRDSAEPELRSRETWETHSVPAEAEGRRAFSFCFHQAESEPTSYYLTPSPEDGKKGQSGMSDWDTWCIPPEKVTCVEDIGLSFQFCTGQHCLGVRTSTLFGVWLGIPAPPLAASMPLAKVLDLLWLHFLTHKMGMIIAVPTSWDSYKD